MSLLGRVIIVRGNTRNTVGIAKNVKGGTIHGEGKGHSWASLSIRLDPILEIKTGSRLGAVVPSDDVAAQCMHLPSGKGRRPRPWCAWFSRARSCTKDREVGRSWIGKRARLCPEKSGCPGRQGFFSTLLSFPPLSSYPPPCLFPSSAAWFFYPLSLSFSQGWIAWRGVASSSLLRAISGVLAPAPAGKGEVARAWSFTEAGNDYRAAIVELD